MKGTEIKALVSLLDDNDSEVTALVEEKIRSLGCGIIPFLELEWETTYSPIAQRKIEELIHELQQDLLFDRLVEWKNGGALDLLEGMWIIATYHYPELVLEQLQEQIEQLYYEVWPHCAPDMNPIDQIKVMNSVFYGTLGFGANTKNFHSASNSMINMVLESKKGNPISLCVVYLLIARKLNLPLYGVNLPNLFVLTYKKHPLQFYINVFNRGIIFSKTDIEHYIAQLNIQSKESFFEPCTNVEIVQRVLRNLIMSYEKAGEPEKIEELEKLLAALHDS